jgi:hypothetical protein
MLRLDSQPCSTVYFIPQNLRPFFAVIESKIDAQWAFGFDGSPLIGLNFPLKTFAGGWFVSNYEESNNPFVLMSAGAAIDKERLVPLTPRMDCPSWEHSAFQPYFVPGRECLRC